MQATFRQRLLASTLLVGAAGVAAPAWAQPADEDTQETPVQSTIDTDAGEGSESIVVTGSRIQRRDLTSTSPLSVVQDEEFKLSGAVNVEQVLNTLPQVIPGASAFDNNPGGGVATLDLRGLGPQRTLVLVNSRRWMFYDENQLVDLNTIPSFLLDSVDVVTGGASAVYGSDAVAGVVNFRLRQDLNGVLAGGQYSLTEEGDGRRFNAYIAVGSEFADGRGSVTAFGEYFKRGDIFAGDRSWSSVTFTENDDATGFVVGGSPTNDRGLFFAAATASAGAVNLNPCTGPFGSCLPGQDTTNDVAAQSFPRGSGTLFDQSQGDGFGCATNVALPARCTSFRDPEDFFNYAPTNYLMVPQERWLLGGYGSYEISEAVTAFTEVSFVNNRVQNELAPSPVGATLEVNIAAIEAAGYLGAAEIAALRTIDDRETAVNNERANRRALCASTIGGRDGNPNNALTAQEQAEITACQSTNQPLFQAAAAPGVVQIGANRRIVEGGSRNVLDERNAFRVLGGVKGPAFADFDYEAYYSYARTRNGQIQSGNISRSLYEAGVQSGAINIFGPDTLTAEDVEAIAILTQNTEISVLQVASASLSGTFGNFGLGADDIGLAVGAEWRSVRAEVIPDTAAGTGDVVGFNATPPTEGGYNVKELFGELRVPVIARRPFFHRLDLTGAVRYSDYSLAGVGSVWTYAAGAEWAPIPDITFRGQYQRAVRAPNVAELFGGTANGFPPANDPCSNRTPSNQTATVRTLCEQQGVPAGAVFTAGVQPAVQIEASFGGNPNLGEEKSDTYTVGAVIRPSFIPRLNIAIDYYNITVDDYITLVGGGSLANIFNLCFNVTQDINSLYCQILTTNPQTGGPARNPATGAYGDEFLAFLTLGNVASFETSGVDLQVDYTLPLDFGLMGEGTSRLNFFFLGTWLDKWAITPDVAFPDDSLDCTGRFGNLCDEPRVKWKWTSRVSWIDGPLTTSLRWRHIGSARDDDDDSDFFVERLRAKDYFDLSFAYDVSDEFSFTVGVNNLFDTRPQLLGDNQEQTNTYPNTYDVLGRDYFVSASFRF